jgi:hypothetical protein
MNTITAAIFAIYLTTFVSIDAVDYCSLCKNHIACNNNELFWSNCSSNAQIIPLTEKNIEAILDGHNKLRNKIAGGEEKGFNSASKMMTLVSKFLYYNL